MQIMAKKKIESEINDAVSTVKAPVVFISYWGELTGCVLKILSYKVNQHHGELTFADALYKWHQQRSDQS